MKVVIGVFHTTAAAEEAAVGLRSIGLRKDSVLFFSPEHPDALNSLPSTGSESAGMGAVMGGYLGGVVGGSSGLAVGSALASLLDPGAGLIFTAGVGAAVALALVGAAAGAVIGTQAENMFFDGISGADMLTCRELLDRGWSLVIAIAGTKHLLIAANAVLRNHRSEAVSVARKQRPTQRIAQAA